MNITLRKEESTPDLSQIGHRGSWPLRISAFSDEAMTVPAKVFVYQRAGMGSSLNGDSFSCVADVLHMQEVPEDTPTEDVPFFRTSVMHVICRSQTHVSEFWNDVVSAVRELVTELQDAEVMSVTETITISPL